MNRQDRLWTCANCLCGGLSSNPMASRLLGLCPLLAVTTSVLKAVTMAGLLMLVSLLSTCFGSVLRASVFWRFKPIYFALVASLSTIIVVNAAGIFFPLLVDSLGVYALLLAANCLVISQLQEIAEHAPVLPVVRRVTRDSLWISAFLLVMATLREFGTYGGLFHDKALLENSLAADSPRWISILGEPAGALLLLAILLALINYYQTSWRFQQADRADSRVMNSEAGRG